MEEKEYNKATNLIWNYSHSQQNLNFIALSSLFVVSWPKIFLYLLFHIHSEILPSPVISYCYRISMYATFEWTALYRISYKTCSMLFVSLCFGIGLNNIGADISSRYAALAARSRRLRCRLGYDSVSKLIIASPAWLLCEQPCPGSTNFQVPSAL